MDKVPRGILKKILLKKKISLSSDYCSDLLILSLPIQYCILVPNRSGRKRLLQKEIFNYLKLTTTSWYLSWIWERVQNDQAMWGHFHSFLPQHLSSTPLKPPSGPTTSVPSSKSQPLKPPHIPNPSIPFVLYISSVHTSVQLSSVAQSCLALCNLMDCSTLASLSITNSRSLLKLMSIESVLPSNHLILCHPLLLLPSIFPSIRLFSNESVLHTRWPKYWSFSFNISPSNEYSGLISFMMDLLELLAVQETLKRLLQHHSSKASMIQQFYPWVFIQRKWNH